MMPDRAELDALLLVVADLADKSLNNSAPVDLRLLDPTPLATLIPDLLEADVPHATAWAFETIEVVAQRSAVWAFVLASRYAAQFALAGGEDTEDVFLAPATMENGAIKVAAAPLAAGPLDKLLVCTSNGVFRLSNAQVLSEQPMRTGLGGAELKAVHGVRGAEANTTGVSAWQLLLGAAIVGLGTALSQAAVRYTNEREQFGAPISSFPGLRALIGSASAEVQTARTLLYSHALNVPTVPLTQALSTAADAVVSSAIDTVQSMGGYGYIEDFRVAGMLRDAISLRARAASAVDAWRASAAQSYSHHGKAA